MAGDKTEQPTPKKLREARKKGQVSKSADLTASFLFLTSAAVLVFAGGSFVDSIQSIMREAFRPEVLSGNLPTGRIIESFGHDTAQVLIRVAPLFACLLIVSASIGFLQVNALFAPEAVKPSFAKLNPLKGFQNIFFKARTYVELLKNIVKFGVVFAIVYSTVMDALPDILAAYRLRLDDAARLSGNLMFRILWRVGGAFLLIGAADYLLQRRFYMKEMMMTKQEVKREYKDEEGDPHIKHQRKHLHEEMLHESSIAEVPKATALVVNPTHLAIALRYDQDSMNAPRITAKGQNAQAQRIIAIARESKVPVMRNVPLAHGLYAIEVGHEVPEELYEAVAEVLNWVYRLHEQEAQA